MAKRSFAPDGMSAIARRSRGVAISSSMSGDNGVAGGVFADYECKSGVAGYSVLVEPTYGSFNDVYLNTLTLANCEFAGDNGVNGGVWADYECQLGVAGYSLKVSN